MLNAIRSHGAVLVDRATHAPLVAGEIRRTGRDEPVIIRGGRAPHHAGSSGRVFVSHNADEPSREFFPNVVNAAWVSSHTLFNCCTRAAEPDWSQFTRLEIGGCRMSDDDDGSVEGGQDLASSTFFTVYGRTACGEAVAITDTDKADLWEANRVAFILSRLSGGLPVTRHGALEGASITKEA